MMKIVILRIEDFVSVSRGVYEYLELIYYLVGIFDSFLNFKININIRKLKVKIRWL